MFGLVISAILALSLLPPMPKDLPRKSLKKITMVLQWVLVPVIILVFGAIPGIDSQTRLMLGKGRLGYWVTPKHRKL
jgi:hypothetical protein